MFFVEADGPGGVGPSADQDRAGSECAQVGEQVSADALLLAGGENVGVANQGDVAHGLNAHDAGELATGFVSPENYTFVDFMLKLVCGHVGVGPAIGRDDVFVGPGAVVDDGVNLIEVLGGAAADHEGCVSLPSAWSCGGGFWRRAATGAP